MRVQDIIRRPLITEKSTELSGINVIAFEVDRRANKIEVKRAVEQLFEVEVERVQMVNVKGKAKRFGRTLGKRSDFKKAYVRLKPGHDINFAGAE